MDIGTLLTLGLPVVAVIVMLVMMRRQSRQRHLICTRCEGSGNVDEHWPDPSQPGGWHDVHGTCPKCGGVGKV